MRCTVRDPVPMHASDQQHAAPCRQVCVQPSAATQHLSTGKLTQRHAGAEGTVAPGLATERLLGELMACQVPPHPRPPRWPTACAPPAAAGVMLPTHTHTHPHPRPSRGPPQLDTACSRAEDPAAPLRAAAAAAAAAAAPAGVSFAVKSAAAAALFLESLVGIAIPLALRATPLAQWWLSLLNCFSGGVFLAAGLVHLVPHCEEAQARVAAHHPGVSIPPPTYLVLVTLGYYLVLFVVSNKGSIGDAGDWAMGAAVPRVHTCSGGVEAALVGGRWEQVGA
jgi:hypothetical protein